MKKLVGFSLKVEDGSGGLVEVEEEDGDDEDKFFGG